MLPRSRPITRAESPEEEAHTRRMQALEVTIQEQMGRVLDKEVLRTYLKPRCPVTVLEEDIQIKMKSALDRDERHNENK